MKWFNMIVKEGSSSNVWKPKIEHDLYDLQSSGNEIGTGNTETSKGMKTSVKTEKVPEFSPYFESECGMIGENGNGIGDRIAPTTIILPYYSLKEESLTKEGTDEFGSGNCKTSNGKSAPEKHEKVPMLFPHFQNDYEKERGNGKCILALPAPEEANVVDVRKNEEADNRKKGDNLEENVDEIAIGKIKSKKRKKSKKDKHLGDNQENIDQKSSCYDFDKGFGEDKLATGGKLKSKEKKKVAEIKMLENDEHGEAETSKLKHKKHEPQGDNGEKIDPELCCYGSAGKGDQTAVEKVKSKRKRRSKKCVAQVENKEKIDPKPCCEVYDIGFVEDMQVSNEKIKSVEKKAVEDELQETDHGTKTSKFKLKKKEPEAQKNTVQVDAKKIDAKPLDNGSKSEPFSFPISKDLMGDKVLEDGSRVESSQQQVQEGCAFSVVLTCAANGSGFESISIKFKKKTVESAMVRKTCHCSQIDNVEKSVEVEALENGNGNETGKVKLKKNRKSSDERTVRSMNDK